MATLNSAFDILDGLTVDEALSDPHFMPGLVLDEANGEDFTKVFFRDVTATSNVIGWRDAAVAYMEDDPEPTAEFGEIPVSDPTLGDLRTAAIEKITAGARVSWEQRNDNDMDAVKTELLAQKNTITRFKARNAVAAFNNADVQELAVETAWDAQGAQIASDFLDATELILGAEDENGNYFNYTPNTLLINPLTLNLLKRDEEVQKLYIGDMAHANPLFAGISTEPLIFGDVQIVKSHFVPKGEAYLTEQGKAGFMAQREAEWISGFYEERGPSGRGGANQSYRSDYTHRRKFIVDAPKAVVKLTGLTTS